MHQAARVQCAHLKAVDGLNVNLIRFVAQCLDHGGLEQVDLRYVQFLCEQQVRWS